MTAPDLPRCGRALALVASRLYALLAGNQPDQVITL